MQNNLKALVVFNGVRAVLNDQDDTVFHNSVILPYFEMAYEKLRLEVEDSIIPLTIQTSAPISIPQGVKDIGGPTGPALPNDFIEILECWEIPAGTSNDYMMMRRNLVLPKTSILTAYLEVYSFNNQYIQFLGADGDIQVKLDYIGNALGPVTDENSIIKVTNTANYLKFATGALISQLIGEDTERATILSGLAQDALDTLMSIKVKGMQSITFRRRPFMRSYKLRGGMNGR